MNFLLRLTLAIPVVFAQSLTQYVVHNKCPQSINLLIGGQFDSVIPTGGSVTKFLGPNAGFFYTDANGGTKNGGATRAGFFLESSYYYMVIDTGHFNTGMSITPRDRVARQGYCVTPQCDSASCGTAYTSPPTRFPPTGSTAPNPPLYACPAGNTIYDITFCPTGKFPPNQGQAIHPNGNSGKCLDVRGAVFVNGTPVQIYDCNNTPAQRWILNHGSTKVKLAGSNFCLDAGSSPHSGVGMKIWQCYDNLPAQQWFYTTDNRIALEGRGQCLDLRNGVLTNGNQVQTWKCTDFNTNQIWTL